MYLPYFIEAKVLDGNNYRYNKIVGSITVPAILDAKTGRQIIYPPGRPNGLDPGAYTGDMTPILTKSDSLVPTRCHGHHAIDVETNRCVDCGVPWELLRIL